MKLKFRYLLLACAFIGASVSSCSDDDTIKQALEQPETTVEESTYMSLAFRWDKVDNAIQYGYMLYDPEGTLVDEGVTPYTELFFTGLKPSTTYTLKIWAFPSLYSDFTTSPDLEITATTADLQVLDTPDLTIKAEGAASISWNAVENADYYMYEVSDQEGNVVASNYECYDTSIVIRGLAVGTYNIWVCAVTSLDGYKTESEKAYGTFSVEPQPVWTVSGTYTSYRLNNSWEASLTYFDDGSYSITNWYNTEGSEIKFFYTYDAANQYNCYLDILNGSYDGSTYLFTVQTGNSACPELFITPWYGYSGISGDRTSGRAWFGIVEEGNYYPADDNCYDIFEWDLNAISVDDICGEYTMAIDDGWYYYDTSSWAWSSAQDGFTADVTITKVDATHVQISDIYWDDCPVTAELDGKARTLTIPLNFPYTTYMGYYIASQYNEMGMDITAPEVPVVMTVNDDMTISMDYFDIWLYWYDFYGAQYDYYYKLLMYYSGTFTKK